MLQDFNKILTRLASLEPYWSRNQQNHDVYRIVKINEWHVNND